jgi:hypothetical protein
MSSGINIGTNAGEDTQDSSAIAIGNNAGKNQQHANSLAIGVNAGQKNQGTFSIAIGKNSGQNSQDYSAVSVGQNAGQNEQSNNAVAVGQNAGQSNQQQYAIAIGTSAGQISQGTSSIAIGHDAGQTNQPANCIILNASSKSLNASTPGLFIQPLRSASQSNPLFYNSISNELTYFTCSASDKTNVVNLPSGLSANLYSLQPRQFTYIPDGTTNYGFIANEVFQVDPALVVVDSSNNPMNLKWFDIITYLVAEIQTHKQNYNKLSSDLKNIETNISQFSSNIKNTIARLQNSVSVSQDSQIQLKNQLQSTQIQLQNQIQDTNSSLQNIQTNFNSITTPTPVSAPTSEPVIAPSLKMYKMNFRNLLQKSPFS